MDNDINIGDIIKVNYTNEMKWIKKPDPLVVIDILERSGGWKLIVIDGEYLNSAGETRNVIDMSFVEKDIVSTRNITIDRVFDDE